MQVDIYRNLHKGGYSVKNKESGTDGYDRVIDESPVDSITVTDVEFVIWEGKQQQVREQQCKNAHAFVRGEWVDESVQMIADRQTEPLTYDPYKYDTFVHAETEEPVTTAEVVRLDSEGMHAVL
jgi:hypothetical protein